ncbi:MAG: amidohydrolase family protein [Halobacteriota archaeon]
MSRKELTLSGRFVYGNEFEVKEGFIVIERGKIKEIGEDRIEAAVKGIIVPSFVNAHTHIGDSIAKEPDFMPLEQLVGPGGFKHKILTETPYDVLVSAMKGTIEDIFATGTQMFADFREGGVSGVTALTDAVGRVEASGKDKLSVRIFGRPGDGTEDYNRLFDSVEGIGVSSVANYEQEYLVRLVEAAKRNGKQFAIHAGEQNADDITGAIELEPDFIVHLTKATQQDFQKMYDRNIDAVVCIRSNLVTGVGLPPLRQMFESGLTVAAGTDNVMFNSPDIFSELEFISKLFPRLEAKEVLKLCTWNAAKVLQADESIGTIEEGKSANLLVISEDTPNMSHVRNTVKAVVRRATRSDLAAIIHEGVTYSTFFDNSDSRFAAVSVKRTVKPP